ncbi:MAG: glutamate-5-semialdehyde dehydrogenase [Deltaproteobacteria bacterium]|jgi:glutamate-5-semialdehyde dehydrogenase|nr:glutamate-5-semialdehyde dehydrogenase [Deltaproteobacteria bacterium]
MPLQDQLEILGRDARQAARPVARATQDARTQAINNMAELLLQGRQSVEEANREDMKAAHERKLSQAMCDRLELSGTRIDNLAQALREIAELEDPVGSTTRAWERPNGLKISKVRLPLGVIMMIYESRPNVTMDAAALCIRSGNAVVLRGGSEAMHTNRVLAAIVQQALTKAGLPEKAVQLVPTQEREAIDILLTLDQSIDLVIPRGGENLIRRVVERSRIPVVQHYKGVCHVYVDSAADLDKASEIAFNAKVQRPGVCNAMETLLVDKQIADTFIPEITRRYADYDVEIRGCASTCAISELAKSASDSDWETEFLDLVVAIRVVDGLDGAIAHIDEFGSNHTASVVTENSEVAEIFLNSVDASCVMVNASTRFNDGGELGLGAEMGISTTRIHAYGPMGVEALTAEKYVVRGTGQVRK